MCRQFDSGPRHQITFRSWLRQRMALYASAFLIGAATVLLVVLVARYVIARHTSIRGGAFASGERPSGQDAMNSPRMWSAHVGSLDEPARPSAQEKPAWQLHAEAAVAGNPGVYKSRSASPVQGEHWDPYAESQSRASRAKAARRKPRPHRSPLPPEPVEMGAGVEDPFVLLGVSRVASAEEIERAYRRKVSSIHPDKFHGDPVGRQHAHEELKQLNAAIKVLRDRRDRTPYDGGQAG
jgi:hypothetical protein